VSKFIEVIVRERIEGAPGFIEPEEFKININIDQITIFNRGGEKDSTFVRLSCGAALNVVMSYDKFCKRINYGD